MEIIRTIETTMRHALPTDVAEMAINNMSQWMREATAKYDVAFELSTSFAWDNTPQGAEYWANVHEYLLREKKGWYMDSEAMYFATEAEAEEHLRDLGYKSIEQAYDNNEIYYYEGNNK